MLNGFEDNVCLKRMKFRPNKNQRSIFQIPLLIWIFILFPLCLHIFFVENSCFTVYITILVIKIPLSTQGNTLKQERVPLGPFIRTIWDNVKFKFLIIIKPSPMCTPRSSKNLS